VLARLELGILAFKTLETGYETWRRAVYVGESDANEATDEFYRDQFGNWVATAAAVLGAPRTLVWDGYGEALVALVHDAHKQLARGRALLADWTPAALARNPSFRRTHLSPADQARLDGLMTDGGGRLKVQPRSLVDACR
jgi:hypothetical protein